MSIEYNYDAVRGRYITTFPITSFRLIQESTVSVFPKEIEGYITDMDNVKLIIDIKKTMIEHWINNGNLFLTKKVASELAHGILKLLGEER